MLAPLRQSMSSSAASTGRLMGRRALFGIWDYQFSNFDFLTGWTQPPIQNFEYAVRGALAISAEELRNVGFYSYVTLPILISYTTGHKGKWSPVLQNHQLQHRESTAAQPAADHFLRQVSALDEYPDRMATHARLTFSRKMPSPVPESFWVKSGKVGAYSHPQGIPSVRKETSPHSWPGGVVLNYLMYDFFLTAGASPGVHLALQTIYPTLHDKVGANASITLFGNESLAGARSKGIEVRALKLSFYNMKELINFVKKERLRSIYMPDSLPSHSFKGQEYDSVELISCNSVSKGMIGECCRSGVESTKASRIFYKVASLSLCPLVQGHSYKSEVSTILESLKRLASNIAVALNAIPGVTCNPAQGATYLFPQIRLLPCAMYCMELPNATGVCMIAGSGFGQEDGTWHFRTTFLPFEEEFLEKCA
ncbi:hypothetical protein BJ742DRAFT_748637 [Cladochytrium replicatum]|nr:hypothetical protein BJ742DRAFT_748637 [Cladochytrium replicatum]